VVSTVASQQEGPGFQSRSFQVLSVWSLHVLLVFSSPLVLLVFSSFSCSPLVLLVFSSCSRVLLVFSSCSRVLLLFSCSPRVLLLFSSCSPRVLLVFSSCSPLVLLVFSSCSRVLLVPAWVSSGSSCFPHHHKDMPRSLTPVRMDVNECWWWGRCRRR